MVNRLKKTQPKAQPASPKANMLKKFGGKFKRAFSRQKQSLGQKRNEAYVQDPLLPATALPDSTAKEFEQLSTENRPGSASALVGVEEAAHSSDDSAQELTATTSPTIAAHLPELISQDAPTETLFRDTVDLMPSTPQRATESLDRVSSTPSFTSKLNPTDRRGLVRSHSSPRLPSSPTTGAASETVIDSAYHSAASSPQSLIKFGPILDEHKGLSKECHEARFKHIKGEEEETVSSEWMALLKWVEAGHQAEVITLENERAAEVEQLKQDRSKVRRRLEMQSREFRAMKREMGELKTAHAGEVDRLKQDRSQVRRRLEMQSREFRALKREMKELKESNDEKIKGHRETQPACKPQSNDWSGAESVGGEEGGVILAEEAETSKEAPCESSQATKDKRSAKETAKEERERQRMLRQRLLEESMPDQPEPCNRANVARPAAVGEVQASTTPQSTMGLNGNNGGPLADFRNLRDQNRGLKLNLVHARKTIAQLNSKADAARAEMATLRAENHFAQLEVGHCHAAIACYHATFEDDNPARTAHLDGLLKRKDEAYADLESRAAECAHLLSEEKKQTVIDNIYNMYKMHGLEKELAHRLNVIQALTEGRDILKEQNDSIIQLFKGKIYPDDAMKAILRDHETAQKDNALLDRMIQERECYVLDAEKSAADLKAAAVVQTHAIDQERLTHRQTLQSLNGLTATNHTLRSRIEILSETHADALEHLSARLRAQTAQLAHVHATSSDAAVLVQRLRAQEAHIAALNGRLENLNAQANRWRLRVLEGGEGFCPMWDCAEVGVDAEGEALRWRLCREVRRVRELEGWIWGVWNAGLGGGDGVRQGVGLGLAEGVGISASRGFTWRDV